MTLEVIAEMLFEVRIVHHHELSKTAYNIATFRNSKLLEKPIHRTRFMTVSVVSDRRKERKLDEWLRKTLRLEIFSQKTCDVLVVNGLSICEMLNRIVMNQCCRRRT